ncbi:TPA: hypothetical protein ACHHA7_002783 [Staphylococcus aureus]|nr:MULTISPECIES: hypothetical protein [Staphylococcus]MCE4962650.1 hypothetical protein [Staphylococcus chromogenes]MCE6047464.1 hypothetical protein [Staphylococcus aureus]MDG6617002.1 hypothetical protein [Staphylococcus aureus]HCY0820902.1 hypothetical protein [Staphylococcus aureus]HCZ0964283.1 hypothetical protein [Staphylococcus aureus]
MATTNLDKFLTIEQMMNEAQGLMEPYLSSLEARYEYMNVLRQEYSNLSHALGKVQQRVLKQGDKLDIDADVKNVAKSARDRIDEHIEAIEEDLDDDDSQPSVNQLKRARENLEGDLNEDSIGEAWRLLKVRKIEIEELNVLMDLIDAMEDGQQDTAESIVKKIDRLRSDYTSGFVRYREALEQGEDVQKEVDEVIADLEDGGYAKEVEILTDARPSIAEERGLRPDPQPLLDLLNPIKSAGLEYFQSRNKNSQSYDLNVAFAKEVAYTRRALLEDREYIGTRNAFSRLNTAFEELSSYMYERFHQLGGTPENYHGHENR